MEYCKAVTENGMMKLMVVLDTFNFLGIEEPSFCCVAVSASILTFGSEKKGTLFEGHISHFSLNNYYTVHAGFLINTSLIRIKHLLGI